MQLLQLLLWFKPTCEAYAADIDVALTVACYLESVSATNRSAWLTSHSYSTAHVKKSRLRSDRKARNSEAVGLKLVQNAPFSTLFSSKKSTNLL